VSGATPRPGPSSPQQATALPACRRRRGLSESLQSLQLVAVNATSDVAARLKSVQAQLDAWQISQHQGVGVIIELLGQQQSSAEQSKAAQQEQYQQVMAMLAEVLERVPAGVAQAQQEIASVMQLPDLTTGQKQVGSKRIVLPIRSTQT
jgi:hypothetical protein